MRATFCAAVCAMALGCGSTQQPAELTSDEGSGAPPRDQSTKPSRPVAKKSAPKETPKREEPVAFDGLSNTISNDYLNDSGRADAKYKNKRVRLRGRIDQIGQKEGSTLLGYSATHEAGKTVEPTVVFLFTKETEKEALNVKKGQIVLIEGVCRGRVNDGIQRPMGFTFHVRVESCRLVPPDEEPR
jgi:hypothetical protein